MFEVGSDYEIAMIEEGEEVRRVWRVAAFEPPLLRLSDILLGELIVNVGSVNFVSAKLVGEGPGNLDKLVADLD